MQLYYIRNIQYKIAAQ